MMKKPAGSVSALPWIAAIAFFMQSLDTTILNTAIPTIAKALNCSPLEMQSAIIAYALTVAMLIPISGWLADRFGTQKVFIIAVSLFTLGSLLCALSNSLIFLVVSRIVQGIGGAMMMPVARLTLLRAYPRSELLRVLNIVTIPGLVGPVVGPLLGGLLVTYTTWHWIFLINLPIGLLGIIYAKRSMPDFTMPRRRFDSCGFLLFSLGLVLISSGMVLISEDIMNKYLAVLTFFSGFLLILGYILYASKAKQPLIRLSLFKTRTFSIGISGCILSRLGIGCIPFLMPLMLQIGFGYPPLTAGLMMAPIALGSITAKSTVTQVLKWFGYRRTLIVITLLIGLTIAQFSLQQPHYSIWLLIIPLFIMGVFMSTQFTSLNTLTLGYLDNEHASEGNSLMAVTQQLSISFGIALCTAVFSFFSSQSGSSLDHFHYTFITMGAITVISSVIFFFLKSGDGDDLVQGRKKVTASD